MKTSTRLAAAFLALAGTASTAAFAADRDGMRGHGPRSALNFQAADADSSGDITFDEFAAAVTSRVSKADANNDGKMTVEEIANELERMRNERMAQRLVERFDADGDGAVTTAEIEQQQKKRFALLDRNNDGKISQEEMPRRAMRDMGGNR